MLQSVYVLCGISGASAHVGELPAPSSKGSVESLMTYSSGILPNVRVSTTEVASVAERVTHK